MMEATNSAKQADPLAVRQQRSSRRALGIRFLFFAAAVFAITALFVAPHCLTCKYTGTAIFDLWLDPASEDISGSRTTSVSAIQSTLVNDVCRREHIASAARELGLMDRDGEFPRGPDQRLTLKGRMAEQKLVTRLQDSIRVDLLTREEGLFYRIEVSFTHSDPDLAAEMPNTLVRNYIVRTAEQIVSHLSASLDFLRTQVGNADGRLQEATRERIDFEAQHVGMLPDSPVALHERTQQISTDIDALHRQHAVAKETFERLKALAEKAATAPGEPIQVVKGPNPELDRLGKELRRWADLLERQIVLNGMTEDDGVVQRLHKKIGELTKQIEQTPAEAVIQEVYRSQRPGDGLATALAAAQSEVEMAEKELQRLQERLNAVQVLVVNYAPVRQAYLELCTKVAELEVAKKSWQYRLTGVQMALEAEVAKRRTHLEAVQLAEKQFRPQSPKLLYVLGFALIGGLFFGGLLVFNHNIANPSIARTLVRLATCFDRSVVPTAPAYAPFGAQPDAAPAHVETFRRWLRILRSVLKTVFALILVVLLAAAILNVTLWLHYPDQYKQWQEDPTAFVGSRAAYYYQRGVREL